MIESEDMERRAGGESAPLGVIGCTKAGFELVGQNLWLILFPIALDLLLWFGPRLSVVPLLDTLHAFLRSQLSADPALAPQLAQVGDLIETVGQQYNLLSLLSSVPLLTVPSLLAGHAPGPRSPLVGPQVHDMDNPVSALLFGTLFLLVGLVLGVAFLSLVAQRVAATRPELGSTPALGAVGLRGEPDPDVPGTVRFLRVLLFVGVVLLGAAVLLPMWALVFGFSALIAPVVGVFVWIGSVGIVAYICLHLLFVVHSVLLGGRRLMRAIWESVSMIHSQLPSVLGLVVVIVVVYQGLGFVWSLASAESWALLVGILGNACIAAGLVATTFVFYQQRLPFVLEAARQRQRPRKA